MLCILLIIFLNVTYIFCYIPVPSASSLFCVMNVCLRKMFLTFAIPIAAWYVKRQKMAWKKLNSQLVSEKQILSGVAVSQAFCPICNPHVISVEGSPAAEDGSDRCPVLVICCLDALHDHLETISNIQCWDGLSLSLLQTAGAWVGAHQDHLALCQFAVWVFLSLKAKQKRQESQWQMFPWNQKIFHCDELN